MPLPALRDAVARLSGWMASRTAADGRGARPLGLHFEGPFVSPARAGALHRECLLDGADDRKVDAFFSAAGAPPGRPMVTLAPEIPAERISSASSSGAASSSPSGIRRRMFRNSSGRPPSAPGT